MEFPRSPLFDSIARRRYFSRFNGRAVLHEAMSEDARAADVAQIAGCAALSLVRWGKELIKCIDAKGS